MYLTEAQPERVGYIRDSIELNPPIAHTLSLMGQGSLIDARKCGSGAYRITRTWQNLMPRSVLEAKYAARLPKPTMLVEAALEADKLSTSSARPKFPHIRRENAIP